MQSGLGEFLRKTVHIAGVLAIPILDQLGAVKTAALFFLLAAGLYAYPLVVEKMDKTPFGRFLRAFRSVLDFLERKDHLRYSGAIGFFVSIGFIALALPEKIAAISIIVLCVGDGISTLAGRVIGRNRLFHNESKSWEGSLSGFAASAAVCLLVTNPPTAVFASFVGMAVESLDMKISDNLSVPLVVGVTTYAVSYAGLLAV
ncbi:MAG: hypothetical protein HY516_05495 [Candidatus Aenigmarchaeota archaeon]|nr:hypothetical protein [Candidatus Aenigmarchaeota archaeon]